MKMKANNPRQLPRRRFLLGELILLLALVRANSFIVKS
jgi:hypothetical protein